MGEEAEVKRKNWLYIISPCVIALGFLIYGLIDSYVGMKSSGGWSFLGILICAPLLLVVILIDVFIKSLVKDNIFYLWLIEIILIAIVFYLGFNRFS